VVLYYWNKYKVVERYNTNPDTWPWEYKGNRSTPYSTDDSGYERMAQSFLLDDEGKVVPNYTSYNRNNMSRGVPYYYMYNPHASMESGSRYYVKNVYSEVRQLFVAYDYWECKAENVPKEIGRGQLVQSNIVAVASAYVNGYVHSDGFWYERVSIVQTAPTTPGTFTQPSGTLEIGDSKVFTVGASSDANHNLSKYIWEVSINGAAYSKVGETTLPSFTYKIPIARSLKMRVKAVDTTGLQSAYRESSSYTVHKRNTAPTRPGAFTQPSGTLEIGDSKVFVVGASTDADGNLSKYIWEVSINGAAFSKVGETISRSLTYKIPIATNLKMRVKAVDTGGLESEYRESSTYMVTMPMYYWSKFNTVETPIYTQKETILPKFRFVWDFAEVYSAFKLNQQTGEFESNGVTYPHGFKEATNDNYADVIKYYQPIIDQTNQRNIYKPTRFIEVFVAENGNVFFYADAIKYYVDKTITYSKGVLVQSDIQALEETYPMDGKHTDGFWYVRGSRVNQAIAPPGPFTSPIQGKKFKPNEVINITFGASNAANLTLYEVDYRYNNTGSWMRLPYTNRLSRSLTITTDKTLKTLQLRVRAKNTNNVYSDYVYSDVFGIEHNVAPTVSLRQPSGTVRLYENDTLNIEGTAFDSDPDQSVTVYYQINNEPRKVLATNISQERFALSKQLTFKGGKLYNGKTAITGNLSQGLQRLFVWAEDTEKGISSKIERRFSVIPNRAPMLSVDAVVPSGVVDNDKFKISGKVLDEDANATVKVTRRINAGEQVEIYSGSGGPWEFDVKLAQLITCENTIVLEVVDNYGAKTSKTIKLNKKEVKTPILQSVARYQIEPPSGSAKGILLFIQRDEALEIKVELSMTEKGGPEQYTVLTPVNTAPITAKQGVVEDTFELKEMEAKQRILLKITLTRKDLASNHKILLITGAVD